MQEYLHKMRKLTDEELVEVFKNSERFVTQAVEAAYVVSVERGITGRILEYVEGAESETKVERTENAWQENKDYLPGGTGRVFTFKARGSEHTRFESLLMKHDIAYYKEETADFPALVYFYVGEGDYDAACRLYRNLRVRKAASQYADDGYERSGRERAVLIALWFIFVIALIVFLIPLFRELYDRVLAPAA